MKKILVVVAIALVLIVPAGFYGCGKKPDKDNLSTYTINAEFNDEENTVTASMKLDYVNSTGIDLSVLKFNLYPNAYTSENLSSLVSQADESSVFPGKKSYGGINVSNVEENGTPADFVLSNKDETLSINLHEKIKNGEHAEISMNFVVKLPNARHRLGYTDNCVNLGNWYPVVCSCVDGEFIECLSNMNGDYFVSDCANYNVNVIVSEDFIVAGSGSSTFNDGKYCFKNYSVRDFALVLSRNFNKITDYYGGTELIYYYFNDKNAIDNFQIFKSAFEYFSNNFGAYPYKTLSVCETDFSEGGMEYPALVYVSTYQDNENYRFSLVHEVAHNWWYGVVGNNQLSEAFLDEGLTEYSSILFFESMGIPRKERLGRYKTVLENAIEFSDKYGLSSNFKINRTIYQMKSSLEYVCSTYYKPSIMLDELKNSIGDEKFFNALRGFYLKYKFKIATFKEFAETFGKKDNAQEFLLEYVNKN